VKDAARTESWQTGFANWEKQFEYFCVRSGMTAQPKSTTVRRRDRAKRKSNFLNADYGIFDGILGIAGRRFDERFGCTLVL
jgi:hypothetical protein